MLIIFFEKHQYSHGRVFLSVLRVIIETKKSNICPVLSSEVIGTKVEKFVRDLIYTQTIRLFAVDFYIIVDSGGNLTAGSIVSGFPTQAMLSGSSLWHVYALKNDMPDRGLESQLASSRLCPRQLPCDIDLKFVIYNC